MSKGTFKGLDSLRVIAAIFVVGIHTFPLAQINETLDTMLFLVVGRFAVPFFLMITGYFVLSPLAQGQTYLAEQRYQKFMRQNLFFYGAMMLLYLPLSVYNGTLTKETTVLAFLQKVLFEGTFYHLWYLPATLLGLFLTRQMLRYSTLSFSLGLSLLLYLIGLGGDSYSQLILAQPVFKATYEVIFSVSPYTRNGLFLVPIFLLLGVLVAQERPRRYQLKPGIGFALSLLALLIEGWWRHYPQTPRHDSMYLALLPLSYYLFKGALRWRGFPLKNQKKLATWLYFLHPLMIVMVRLIGKLSGQEQWVVTNQLLHFIIVVLVTGISAAFLIRLSERWQQRSRSVSKLVGKRAWKELSAVNLLDNLSEIQQHLQQGTSVMPVIKADAYGHDSLWAARLLAQAGVQILAVATLDEAVTLRKGGITTEILILGYTSAAQAGHLHYYELTQTIVSGAHGRALRASGLQLKTQLKVDTGMHRLGLLAPELPLMLEFYRTPSLGVSGIYSHLSVADSVSPAARQQTRQQITCYNQILTELATAGVAVGATHLQSSYGLLNYPELAYTYVRIGMLLYGSYSQPPSERQVTYALKPVLALKSRLVTIKQIAAGEYIGYGLGTPAQSAMTIGIVSIGYADGVPRQLSQQDFSLHYQGQRLKQIGMICMDMLTVDLTGVRAPELDSEITLFASAGQAEALADQGQTITNELYSRLGARLESPSKGS